MRILHIIDSAGLYGAERVVLTLMEEQSRAGQLPILCSIGSPGAGEKPIEAEARARHLRVKQVRMRNGPNLPGALSILRYARERQIDLLHSHGYKGNILFGLLPRAVRRIPVVATLHGWANRSGASKIAIYEWLDAKLLGKLDAVVVVSAAMLDHPKLSGRSGREPRIIQNAVDSSARRSGEELDRRIVEFCDGRFTVGSIGRLSPVKGQQQLVEAIHELVTQGIELRAVILGGGPLRDSLQARIDELRLQDRVLLPGYVADAASYLHLFDLFALPSLTEGLPITLLEAMQCGTPIVASGVGGVPALLSGGEAGLLVPPADRQELVQAIRAVYEDRPSAHARAERAAELVRTRYSAEEMARQYAEVYAEVVSRA